ncbi:hypothetical protein ONZ45_g10444 [Pleurotus djamor]|nr:hypothetical protein ONZ45_g10444 [Pleurotus djamor]
MASPKGNSFSAGMHEKYLPDEILSSWLDMKDALTSSSRSVCSNPKKTRSYKLTKFPSVPNLRASYSAQEKSRWGMSTQESSKTSTTVSRASKYLRQTISLSRSTTKRSNTAPVEFSQMKHRQREEGRSNISLPFASPSAPLTDSSICEPPLEMADEEIDFFAESDIMAEPTLPSAMKRLRSWGIRATVDETHLRYIEQVMAAGHDARRPRLGPPPPYGSISSL